MPHPRADPTRSPTRRDVLRLAGRAGLASGALLGLAACSAEDRQALLDVDPGRVRLDEGVVEVPEPEGPSARERRRRAVLAGSTAALTTYAGATGSLPPLAGPTGGTADVGAALAVHRAHAEVLAGAAPGAVPEAAGTRGPTLGPEPSVASTPGARTVPDAPVVRPWTTPHPGGPSLPPAGRPLAVLRTGARTAVRAALAERQADDARVDLARLHARVSAARAAQATALAGRGVVQAGWPTTSAGDGVVGALQGLLAQEHRARWSSAVVLAWVTDREEDARTARQAHTTAAEDLADLLRLLGADPVAALPTYPTDDDGRPVDGPESAAALALRLADSVAAATAAVLVAAVEDGDPDWVRASVTALAEAERARWSWGGAPVPWPGG